MKVYQINTELVLARERQDAIEDGITDPLIELPIKCGGCNWETSKIYVAAETLEEAREIYKAHEGGMCAECMTEYLAEAELSLTLPNSGTLSVIECDLCGEPMRPGAHAEEIMSITIQLTEREIELLQYSISFLLNNLATAEDMLDVELPEYEIKDLENRIFTIDL